MTLVHDTSNSLCSAYSCGTLSASGRNGAQFATVAIVLHGQGWSLDALRNWATNLLGCFA